MTKIEKLNLSLGVLAVVLSVVIPLASYYWFVPSVREYQLRGRLEVSGKARRPITQEQISFRNEPEYEVNIRNVGSLPAKQIQITAQYPAVLGEVRDTYVTLEPPLPFDTNDKKNQISIRQALAPNGSLKILFSPTPVRVWVLNEAGDLSLVETGAQDLVIPDEVRKLLLLHEMLHESRPIEEAPKSRSRKR